MDPDLADTGQPYAFTGDDPLNATDPLGLKKKDKKKQHHEDNEACPPGYICIHHSYPDPDYASPADERAALKAANAAIDGPCWPMTRCDTGPAFDVSGSQLLKGAAVVAGGLSLLTGTGDLLDSFGVFGDDSVLSGSETLSRTATISGFAASAADTPSCIQGNHDSCASAVLAGSGAAFSGLSEAETLRSLSASIKGGGIALGYEGTVLDVYGLAQGSGG